MQIFKFGGASLQNPLAIRDFTGLIDSYTNRPLIVVVSAMGKITQALEEVFQKQLTNQPYEAAIEEIYLFHLEMAQALLDNTYPALKNELDNWKTKLIQNLEISYPAEEIEKIYSQVVAWGEILSSRIIYYYLLQVGIPCTWVDARKYIKTKFGFINAQLDETHTKTLIKNGFSELLEENKLILTQGFIGSDQNGFTTTLGKEGSDFTGAILAAALEATSLTIWKDVPGIMNADPKAFKEAIKFDELDYETMAKMSFYGAQVVHPKTIYPLATQGIPLHIRSFQNKFEKGTIVSNNAQIRINVPIYILRQDQVFIQVSLGDFIFFEENHIRILMEALNSLSLRANFLERTPYHLSICITNDYIKINAFLSILKPAFKINCYFSTNLLTIMGNQKKSNLDFLQEKTILAEQHYQSVYQVIYY
ncbi:MAG: hypothetical protein BGO68_04635 [Candidatus Amoebophilus sp. 36-38]|nr:MAG: hypothetical protein BGO68_04635 [Candidatus Amoebophilus sp. 36-38]